MMIKGRPGRPLSSGGTGTRVDGAPQWQGSEGACGPASEIPRNMAQEIRLRSTWTGRPAWSKRGKIFRPRIPAPAEFSVRKNSARRTATGSKKAASWADDRFCLPISRNYERRRPGGGIPSRKTSRYGFRLLLQARRVRAHRRKARAPGEFAGRSQDSADAQLIEFWQTPRRKPKKKSDGAGGRTI